MHPLADWRWGAPGLGRAGVPLPAPPLSLAGAQQLTDGSLISSSLIFPRLSILSSGASVFSCLIKLEILDGES